MRSPWPAKRKAKISPEKKAIVAGQLFLDLMEEKIDPQAVGRRLREEIGLQWTWLSCMQYLSGKEALAVFQALPADWEQGGRTRVQMLSASLVAAHTVANLRSDGRALCASDLAARLKGVDFAAELERHVAAGQV
ncbi:hypothetical protein VDF13_18225 [Xanthomonas campestris pv. raphani]|uniref:hypothetical protein n=1 Tax=Xanthomonas campestris TaxID=339 RepID=UPI00177B5814|nr:hypothetical protein [Xanthomonas campestris]MCC8485793.1 hypothetical protein [Xanthomonas campestris]MDM7868685.1 hypothetical protein [Xanthomonas campestris pv. campestris]MEA9652036.1 hypothetical protein [Xanthomonas campestris pv. raphani]MEA9745187.1 hypothetical protein [Xanthomonas campestris pv. raphani]MEA9769234.1 hypothetical protein [Xanthomonas campestris pv. raphani]